MIVHCKAESRHHPLPLGRPQDQVHLTRSKVLLSSYDEKGIRPFPPNAPPKCYLGHFCVIPQKRWALSVHRVCRETSSHPTPLSHLVSTHKKNQATYHTLEITKKGGYDTELNIGYKKLQKTAQQCVHSVLIGPAASHFPLPSRSTLPTCQSPPTTRFRGQAVLRPVAPPSIGFHLLFPALSPHSPLTKTPPVSLRSASCRMTIMPGYHTPAYNLELGVIAGH